MNRARIGLLVVAIGIAVASSVVAASPASATSPAEQLVADVSSGPFHVQVNAQRAANSPADSATGTFVSHGSLGPVNLITLQGPVTCLDVRGNRAGLFYPIASSTPGLFSQLHSGVFIYLQVNASGHPQLLGFVPVPISSTRSCAPGLALFPITSGTATLTP